MGDEIRHIGRCRRADDLLWRAELDDPPAFHDGNARADLGRFIEVMADEDDGAVKLALQLQQLILQPVTDQRVQRREGLVHQQDRRIGGKGAGKANALLHAAGQLVHLLAANACKADQLQLFGHLAPALGHRHACDLKTEADILRHRAPGQQSELLEHHGHPAAAQAAQPLRAAGGRIDQPVLIPHQRLAPDDRVEPVDGAQQRGLARPGQAHQHDHLARHDVERGTGNAQRLAGFFLDFGAGAARIDQRQGGLGVRAEDDIHIAEGNGRFSHSRLPCGSCPNGP